jgi:excinuclease ABC subunit C
VVDGAIVQGHSMEIKKKLNESAPELLAIAIAELHQRFDSDAKEMIISHDIKLEIPGVKFIIPQRGDKKKLLELSQRNAKYYKLDKMKQKSLVDPERHSKRILNQLMQDLRLKELPVRIECFDNSNLQGDYPVAAMVSFKNAKPDKKEYRHYNIKTVEGPDDFASMQEIILRRYKRLIDEKKELPQLIVVDGGKGQLSAALKSLDQLKLRGKIAIIGIAKRLEEIYFPGDSIPLYIDKKSESLKIIQQLRDEAHRFGITHHRKQREKDTIKSVLTEIEGIGYSTAQKLLWKFKSVKRIKSAKPDEITAVIGNAKAQIIVNYFTKKA